MQVLTVLNEKGGVGKTFIATQLAYFLRYKAGNRVLLIDFDQQNNAGQRLSQSGLAEVNEANSGQVLNGEGEIKVRRPFAVVPGKDDLLALESANKDAEFAQRFIEQLHEVEDFYDICIIDCGPNADVRQVIALAASTHFLVPMQAKTESIEGVEKVLGRAQLIIDNVNPDLKFVGLLLSMVKAQGIQKKNLEDIIKESGSLLLKKFDPKKNKEDGIAVIYERSEYTMAQQENRPVFFNEQGTVKKEATELTRIFINIIRKLHLPVNKPIKIKREDGKLIEVPPAS